MQRQIKFRAWDGEKKVMIPNITLGALTNWTSINHYLWTQFTGLKDKNGKEIYEGDLLKADNGYTKETYPPRIVQWSNAVAAFVLIDSKTKSYSSWLGVLINKKDVKNLWEVIGNIYENPELLIK